MKPRQSLPSYVATCILLLVWDSPAVIVAVAFAIAREWEAVSIACGFYLLGRVWRRVVDRS